ncbi:MAG TPA: glycosyltransferase [Planctomycetota bacterium]|nr:glycosyltransferase [Planctomycetota bacterium]
MKVFYPPKRVARPALSLVTDPTERIDPVKPIDNLWQGYPGPAYPSAEGEALRVLYHTRVARGEGLEAFGDYLARGMPAGAVKWVFTVEEWKDAADGQLLSEHGRVVLLNEYLRWWEFLRVVLDFRPHVAHVNSRDGALWAARCGLPTVATLHGIDNPNMYGAKHADRSIGVSSAVQDAKAICNAIVAPPWPTERQQGLVGWLGRLDEERRPEDFLDALALVPEARARIIGQANRREFDCEAEVAKRGLTDRVEYLGQLPAEQAREKTAECDLLVSGYREEAFGLATAEAMATGVFPIVPQGPGYQERMVKGWGRIIEPTAKGFATAIRDFLADDTRDAKRRPMAEDITRRYSVNRMAEEYLDQYCQLLLPVVDIGIVAHNEVAVTESCLAHILTNTWVPCRLILCDNGSDPEIGNLFYCLQALLGEDRCVLLRSQVNLGAPLARDLIYEQITSPYFVFLDNDMLVPPGWLGPLVKRMRDNPRIGLIAPFNEIYSGDFPTGPGSPGGACNLYRLEAVRAAEEEPGKAYVEPFASRQARADTDLNWRIREAGYEMWNEAVVRMRHLGGLGRKGLPSGLTRRHTVGSTGVEYAHAQFDRKWQSPGIRRHDGGTE